MCNVTQHNITLRNDSTNCDSTYFQKYEQTLKNIAQKRAQHNNAKNTGLWVANCLVQQMPPVFSLVNYIGISGNGVSDNTQSTVNTDNNEVDTTNKEAEKDVKSTETSEDTVTRLTNVDKTTQPELFANLVKKCDSLKKKNPNISDDIIKVSLRNYVNGYKHQLTSLKQQAAQESVVEYVDSQLPEDTEKRDATLNANVVRILKNPEYNNSKISYDRAVVKTNTDLQNHFKELATDYLALRDTDSNFGLDFLEIYTNNLAQNYCKTDKISLSKAISKAEKYVEEHKTELIEQFEQWKTDGVVDPTAFTSEEQLLALNSYMEIAKFGGNDYNMDTKEIAEMLMAKSTYADGKNPDYDISAADSYKFETDLVLNPEKLDPYLAEAHKFMTNKF